jgi:hypothetical protein
MHEHVAHGKKPRDFAIPINEVPIHVSFQFKGKEPGSKGQNQERSAQSERTIK